MEGPLGGLSSGGARCKGQAAFEAEGEPVRNKRREKQPTDIPEWMQNRSYNRGKNRASVVPTWTLHGTRGGIPLCGLKLRSGGQWPHLHSGIDIDAEANKQNIEGIDCPDCRDMLTKAPGNDTKP